MEIKSNENKIYNGKDLVLSGDECYKNEMYGDALNYYQQACNLGNPEAAAKIGVIYAKGNYANGQGVLQDYVKAHEYFKKSACEEYPKGYYYLAKCFENGWGIEQNFDKAAYFYKKAADFGYKKAEKAHERSAFKEKERRNLAIVGTILAILIFIVRSIIRSFNMSR